MAARPEVFSTPHGSSHIGEPALLAEYATLVDARHAIEELEAHGVDGDDISLAGEAALLAEETRGRDEQERADRRMLSSVTGTIVLGGVVGAALGALAGAVIIGIIVLVAPDLTSRGWVFCLLTTWFAAGGALLGAFTQVARRTGFSESSPLTFADELSPPVFLAVYAYGPDVRASVDATHPRAVRGAPDVDTVPPDGPEPSGSS
jgi:hypothetical protein